MVTTIIVSLLSSLIGVVFTEISSRFFPCKNEPIGRAIMVGSICFSVGICFLFHIGVLVGIIVYIWHFLVSAYACAYLSIYLTDRGIIQDSKEGKYLVYILVSMLCGLITYLVGLRRGNA